MFDHIPTLLQADQCLNHVYRQAGCTRCTQACPVHAIELHDGAPVLDTATCVDCGACLPACPTDVFVQRVSPEGFLVQAAEQANRPERLAVACAVHPDPARSEAPVERVLRHSRCLASLNVDHLLALTRDGSHDVWLDDMPCAACAIGQARGLILQAAQAANALLDGFDRPATVRLVSEAAGIRRRDRVRLPVTQAVPGSLARREIFARLRRFGGEAWDEASGPQPALGRMPVSRQRLLRPVQSWSALPGTTLAVEAIPLAAVQVNTDACSACGMCATLCPTGALRLDAAAARSGRKVAKVSTAKTADLGKWQLIFQPAACIDCGICALACPEQAVSYAGELPATALADGETTLAGGRMTGCASCGAAVAVHPHEQERLCYACRRGAGKIDPLTDHAGLMADLTKRTPPAGSDGQQSPSSISQL